MKVSHNGGLLLLLLLQILFFFPPYITGEAEIKEASPLKTDHILLNLTVNMPVAFDGQVDNIHKSFILSVGDDIFQVVEQFSDDISYQREMLFMAFDILREKLKYNTSLYIRSTSDAIPIRYGLMFNTSMISYLQQLRPDCDWVSVSALDEVCSSIFISIFTDTWKLLNTEICQLFRSRFYPNAKEIIANANSEFVVAIEDSFIPTGLGNVLKGFISFFSISNNTKILQREGYILGDFLNVFDDSHIILSLSEYSRNIITWRWLILYDEEPFFHDRAFADLRLRGLGRKTVDEPIISTYFSNTAAVDFLYERARLPTPVFRRIQSAIRRVKFRAEIVNTVFTIMDGLIHPSIGVSVRSWTAPHEKAAENYTFSGLIRYQELISAALKKQNSKSILIAYDNFHLAALFEPFLSSLTKKGFK